MTSSVDKRLIFDYFANKITPLQKRQIEEWLCHEVNQEYFYAWLVEWENQSPLYVPDLETPLQQFIRHTQTPLPVSAINDTADTSAPGLHSGRLWLRWMVAASILLMGVAGWLNRDLIWYQTYRTGFGEAKILTLTDGSRVNLSACSSLQTPRFGFGQTTREVRLKGEATFAVTHLPGNQKFVVKTPKDFNVVVHGTEFTVNTYAHRANVMLRKGKVQVNYKRGNACKQLMLQPGDVVALDQPDQPTIRHHVGPRDYKIWKEQRFTFNNMTLTDFAKLLNETYGLRVDIANPALAKRTLAGSFRAKNADELLQIVSELFSLKVVRQGNEIRFIEPIN